MAHQKENKPSCPRGKCGLCASFKGFLLLTNLPHRIPDETRIAIETLAARVERIEASYNCSTLPLVNSVARVIGKRIYTPIFWPIEVSLHENTPLQDIYPLIDFAKCKRLLLHGPDASSQLLGSQMSALVDGSWASLTQVTFAHPDLWHSQYLVPFAHLDTLTTMSFVSRAKSWDTYEFNPREVAILPHLRKIELHGYILDAIDIVSYIRAPGLKVVHLVMDKPFDMSVIDNLLEEIMLTSGLGLTEFSLRWHRLKFWGHVIWNTKEPLGDEHILYLAAFPNLRSFRIDPIGFYSEVSDAKIEFLQQRYPHIGQSSWNGLRGRALLDVLESGNEDGYV